MARSGVIYGGSGSFKTSQIKWLAHYIAEKTGKATLLLSLDGGGWEPCRPEIEVGMIRAYRCESNILPLVILRKISHGYWPRNPEESDPQLIDLVPVNWDEVGAIAIEGWTSIGAVIMRYLAEKGISVGGEDRNRSNMMFTLPIHVMGQVVNEAFGSSTRGDYNFVKNTLYGLVTQFNSMPCDYILYTALEAKGEDEGQTVYGPAIEGKKATGQCGPWVGDMIHAQDYIVPRTVKAPNPAGGEPLDQTILETTVRYFFRKHVDPANMGIVWPAKPRCTPERMTDLEKRFPGGYFEPTLDGGLDRYLKGIDELAAQQSDTLKGWREKMDKVLGRK